MTFAVLCEGEESERCQSFYRKKTTSKVLALGSDMLSPAFIVEARATIRSRIGMAGPNCLSAPDAALRSRRGLMADLVQVAANLDLVNLGYRDAILVRSSARLRASV